MTINTDIELSEEDDPFPGVSLNTPNRNAPCYCGSNKKYKKCCLPKERQLNSSYFYKITSVPLTNEETQNSSEEPSEEDCEILNSCFLTLRTSKYTTSDARAMLEQLFTLKSKYPENPVILNYISGMYSVLDMQEEKNQVIDETYQRFPNYLFAKIDKAEQLLDEDRFEEAFDVLERAHSLKQLYPNRTLFHITELRSFETCLITYFCGIHNTAQAQLHFQILRNIVGEDDDATEFTKEMLLDAKLFLQFNKVAAITQDTE